jgi:hypothetical protein
VTQRYTHTSIGKLLRVYDKAHPMASEPGTSASRATPDRGSLDGEP